ncbi:MAG: acyl carrier protein [Bacteroidota bacterium]
MTDIEKYNQTFVAIFGVKEQDLKKLTYQGIDAWDSVGHMSLVTGLEDTFDIMFETDDIIDFNSYLKGFDLLSKYGIRL